jgi:isoleucyl-tRNA synthetase
MSDFREELRVGKQILARVIEAYRKFRNTLRYLASNLFDFDPVAHRVPAEQLQAVDRYIVSRYASMTTGALRGYRDYDYPAIFQLVNQFLTVELSAFYADVSKDRLYTFAAGSAERRSAQTAMFIMADGLARLLAPILPVTADELWRHIPGTREDAVHIATFPRDVERLVDVALEEEWSRLREIRDEVNRALETARQGKIIGTSLAAHVALTAGGDAAALLQRHTADLPMLFIVSQVSLDATGPEGVSVSVSRAEGAKCDRCWRVVPDLSREPHVDGLCDRCVAALPAGPSTSSGPTRGESRGGREVA